MRELLEQIKRGLDNNLYYISLFVALALPDICGAIDSEDGTAARERYIQWFNKYVKNKYNNLSGEDCYYFRCSMLHQGSSQHPKSNYSRVLFIEPGFSKYIFHDNVINDALNIDVRIFCKDIIKGVEHWLKDVEKNRFV